MNRRVALLAAACSAWLVTGPVLSPAAAAAAAPTGTAAVRVDTRPARLAAVLGDTVSVRSTVTNGGATATTPLIAHLDVVSLDPDVYVDPEDWSSERSAAVEPLPPGGSIDLSWPVRTVDSGSFAVYVVLLPQGGTGPAPSSLGLPIQLTVSGRRALSAGGTLPVDLGVPLLLAFVLLTDRLRRRARPASPTARR